MAKILTICMRQVRFWEKPRKPKFRVWPFGFGSVQVFKNRNRTEIRFPHMPKRHLYLTVTTPIYTTIPLYLYIIYYIVDNSLSGAHNDMSETARLTHTHERNYLDTYSILMADAATFSFITCNSRLVYRCPFSSAIYSIVVITHAFYFPL